MKKIMFNDKFQLTNAVLEGGKTQTRRIVPKDFFSLTWDAKKTAHCGMKTVWAILSTLGTASMLYTKSVKWLPWRKATKPSDIIMTL